MNLIRKPVFWMGFFALVNAVLIIWSPLLPFVDLPNHLAEATIYRYYDEPGNSFSSYYHLVPWYFPNQFHIWFCSLEIFPTVEIGNKAFYVLYTLLLPLSIYLIVRKLNGNLWISLLSFTLVFGYNVTYGFSGYTISIPFIFLLFYVMILDFERNSLLLKSLIALLLVLLFTMHAQVALFGALIYGACALYRYRKSFSSLLVAFIVTLPLVYLIVNWWMLKSSKEESDTLTYIVNYYSTEYFLSLGTRLELVVYENFQLAEGSSGKWIALFLSLILFIPILTDLKTFYHKIVLGLKERRNVFVLVSWVIALGCFLFLPEKLPGQTPISQRFGIFFWGFFVVFVSLNLSSFTRNKHKAYIVASILVYNLLWIDYFVSFNIINKGFDHRLFEGVNTSDRMSGVISDFNFRGRSTYIHFQNYNIVWNKGIASSKIIDYRFGVIRRNVDSDILPEFYEWGWKDYVDGFPYDNVEYLLVKDQFSGQRSYLDAFSKIRKQGSWELFKNQDTEMRSPEVFFQEKVEPGNIDKQQGTDEYSKKN